jgi:phosphatidylserine/phosphatidylglycerophosphate/cardiolipin synthase-like enzyme
MIFPPKSSDLPGGRPLPGSFPTTARPTAVPEQLYRPRFPRSPFISIFRSGTKASPEPSAQSKFPKWLAIMIASLSTLACSTVITSTNELTKRPVSTAVPGPDRLQTALGRVYAERMVANPLANAVTIVNPGNDALTHRIAMTRMAERSIEMQTYIFKNDLSSMLLLRELMLAADRGVKVRILVDDVGLPPQSSELMLVGHHPNVEVRIFNPFRYRIPNGTLRFSQMAFDFHRLNRRIHNKYFIADGAVMLIGGRNISKEYFDLDSDYNFLDADVCFIGEVAGNGFSSFNQYWDFHMSIPSSCFPEHRDSKELVEFQAKIAKMITENQDHVSRLSEEADGIIALYNSRRFPDYWVKARFLADPPKKAEGLMVGNQILDEVNALLDNARSSVYISNAYVVPLDFYQKFNELRHKGVEVRLSTNSLSSNDVWPVYSGWINYRSDLIDRGVRVHEFRHDARFARSPKEAKSGLHSKIIVIDGKYSVFGSLNLDPRSVWLNTETIVVIESEDFSQAVLETLQEEMSHEKSWEVRRKNGRTVWETARDGEKVTVDHSPDVFVLKRVLAKLVSHIVPEWLL